MKLSAFDSPKLADLKGRLGCRMPAAVGILELLWAFTARHAPTGAVGKWSDEAISAACDWDGRPGKLIRALVASGWLDRHTEHRLIVHDWADHAPRNVRELLKNHKRDFVKPLNAEEKSASSSLLFSSLHSSSPKDSAGDGARRRDEVWEEVLQACGVPLSAPLTSSQRGAFQRAVKEIKEALKAGGLDKSEIGKRARALRAKWPNATLTPSSLARHWAEVIVAAPVVVLTDAENKARILRIKLLEARSAAVQFGLMQQQPNESDEQFLERVNEQTTAAIIARAAGVHHAKSQCR